MTTELCFLPAVELARLLRVRSLSATELVTESLERIAKLDGELNSVVTLDAEGALAQARVAQDRAGAPDAPPFDGVPILIKDLHLTAGMRTTFGNAAMAEFVPTFDDEATARLRRAGFVLLGKSNVPEWGTLPVTESVLLGPCRNPWDPTRTPGGSSGGAAAAVAAGLVPVAHGSDGAGSLRIPAANCGVFGFKPARGRVSNAPLFGDGGTGLSTVGPITRHVADAAALLDVVSGYALGDPHWAPPPVRPFADEVEKDPGRLRVGLVTTSPLSRFDAECVAAAEAAAGLMEALGHVVERLSLPLTEQFRADFEKVWMTGVAANPVDPRTFEPLNAEFAERGRRLSAAELLGAVVSLQLQARTLVAACAPFDVVLSPTLAQQTLPIGALAGLGATAVIDRLAAYVGFTPLANVTGQPSMSLPSAVASDGLPLGVMVTGRPADEATLLRLAAQVQQATQWTQRRPPL